MRTRIIFIPNSKYHIEFPENEIWEFKVFRGNEEIEEYRHNNLILDLLMMIDNLTVSKEIK